MRLDHLLSKEQLSTKVDSGPHRPNVVVGCSKAETLANWIWQRPAFLSTAFRGVEQRLVRLESGDKHPVGYLKEQPKAGDAGEVGLQCQA